MHWKGEMWTKGQKCEPFLYYFVFSHMLGWRRTSGPVLGLPEVAQNAFPSHGSFSWTVSLNACFRLFLKTHAKPFMLIHLCSECISKNTRISCANEITPQIDLRACRVIGWVLWADPRLGDVTDISRDSSFVSQTASRRMTCTDQWFLGMPSQAPRQPESSGKGRALMSSEVLS